MMPQRTILTTGDDIVLAHSWTQTILGNKVASNIESVSRTVLMLRTDFLVRSRAARAIAASATIPTWPSLRVLGQLKALTTEITNKRWLALRLSRSSPAFVVDRLNSMPFNTLA
jgi:hypothetical protein